MKRSKAKVSQEQSFSFRDLSVPHAARGSLLLLCELLCPVCQPHSREEGNGEEEGKL